LRPDPIGTFLWHAAASLNGFNLPFPLILPRSMHVQHIYMQATSQSSTVFAAI